MCFRYLMVSVFMLMCIVLSAQSQTPFYVVSQDDFYQEMTNSVTLKRPLIDNSLRKTGAGILTMQNPRMPRAKIEVLEDGIVISLTNAFENPELPAALQSKAAFWVDANPGEISSKEGGRYAAD